MFKTLLSRYSEDNYFFLVRNYLGSVTTPFHKPQLTNRLCQFFSREDVQAKTLSHLDNLDCTMLSLLAIYGPLESEKVTELLQQSFSYGTLLRRVSNLQERLVLLSDGGKLVFNPLIAEQLIKECSLKPLFGNSPDTTREYPYCSTEFLRSYLSLVAKEKKLGFKDEYCQFFPSYGREQLQLLFTSLSDALVKLCVIPSEKPLKIDYSKAEALLQLDDHRLMCLLLAQEIGNKMALDFSNELLCLLQKLGSLDTNSLKLLLRLLCMKYEVPYSSSLIELLSKWGLLNLDEIWFSARIEKEDQRSVMLVDSDNTISYTGTCQNGDLLYRFSEPTVLDRHTSYHVTKESFVRALDSGLAWTDVEGFLLANTREGNASALLKQLAMIHQRYRLISIYDGLVLSCDERTARLVENLHTVAEHKLRILAPGVYLMKRSTESQWRAALQDAGLMLPLTNSEELVEIIKQADNPLFAHLVDFANKLSKPPCTIAKTGFDHTSAVDKDLELALAETKLTPQQRGDLEYRFKNRMVLVKEQLVAQIINGVIEAGGFDYQGKVSLCRQASGKKNLALQLLLTDQEMVVQALEVAYTPQKEALLKAAIMPTMEVKIIPVSKIFQVRLVRFHLN